MSRVRSPNYPMISLSEAIEKVAAIHKAEQHLAAPKEVIAKALGYNSLHTLAGRTISAIEKYGLLEEVNSDKVKVSSLAISILHPRSPEEKKSAILEAAFKPTLFSAIREEWGGARPSDANLRAYLVRNKFSADALDRVIQIYGATMDLVTQESDGYPDQIRASNGPERQESPMQAAQQPSRSAKVPYETTFTPESGEPFRVTFTGRDIEISGRLTTPERADEMVQAINALKTLLRPAGQGKRPAQESEIDGEDAAEL